MAITGPSPDGSTLPAVLAAVAYVLTAIGGLVKILQQHRRSKSPDEAPDPEQPGYHETWLAVLADLEEANAGRAHAETEAAEARAERDRALAGETAANARWAKCNDELLSELRRRGRRSGGGSSS